MAINGEKLFKRTGEDMTNVFVIWVQRMFCM
jgi:hypothetical protein